MYLRAVDERASTAYLPLRWERSPDILSPSARSRISHECLQILDAGNFISPYSQMAVPLDERRFWCSLKTGFEVLTGTTIAHLIVLQKEYFTLGACLQTRALLTLWSLFPSLSHLFWILTVLFNQNSSDTR